MMTEDKPKIRGVQARDFGGLLPVPSCNGPLPNPPYHDEFDRHLTLRKP